MANVELHNPATEGVAGLKGISPEKFIKKYGYIPEDLQGFKQYKTAVSQSILPVEEVGVVGLGDSRLDKKITSLSQLEDLNEFRGQEQSEVVQAVKGLLKGAILAGTTFLDGTLGLATGIFTGLNNLIDKDDNTGFWQGLWQNEFSQMMNDVNKASEEIIKNYYTKDELENPLAARNIFSGNFIGDKFLKNIGFTVGAYYSGKFFTSFLNASKLPTILGKAMSSSRAPKHIMSGSGAVVSALNEGRIMALEDSNNWRLLQEQQAEERYNQKLKSLELFSNTSNYESLVNNATLQYQEELNRIQEDQAKMGNMEMFLNIPLLTASNLFQFGKLYANGFKSQRILSKLNKKNALQITANSLGSGLSEGLEEVAQGAISNIAGLGYEQDVMNFYAAKRDLEAEKTTIDWMKAISKGLNDTFNSSSTAEEFLIGSLTGLLGMPVFGKANTKNAWLGKDKIIGLAGGIGGEIQDAREYNERIDKIVNYINERTANNKDVLNYYQGLIRHAKTQKDMDAAASVGNTKDFKNAEFEQMLSDIMMFDNAGKIEDFMTIINAAYDTSDANLDAIIENTTTTLEDGAKKGPFIDSSGNKMTATEEGKAEMIKQINQAKDAMINTLNNYIKVKNDIDVSTGESLTDDELETLVSLRMKTDNWRNRITELHSTIKEKFTKLSTDYHRLAYETANKAENADKELLEVANAIFSMVDKSPEELAILLASNPKYIESLYETVLPLVKSGQSSLDISALDTLTEELKDVKDLWLASAKFNRKFNDYIQNPESLKKDLEETYTKLEETFEQSQIEKYSKDILEGATDINSLKEVLENIPKTRLQPAFLKALENASEEQKKVFKDFDDLDTIATALQTFDLQDYDGSVVAIIASNMDSILKSATSKEDVLNALNTLKEALSNGGNNEAAKAVEDLIDHINTVFEEAEKAANPEQEVEESKSGGTSLLGGMTPTSQVSEKDSLMPDGALPINGSTREEAMQNAIDKIDELFNNGNVEVIEEIANRGLYNTNLTPEDIETIQRTAKEYLEEKVVTVPEEAVRIAVEKKIEQQEVNYKRDKTLASTVVTDYSIYDAKNKKKVPYVPTEEDLLKIQKFLKTQGTYSLMESGKIGVLNSKVKDGININFIVGVDYPNTIFLATEVTPEFKRRVNTTFSPVVIGGKEYAILGVLNNNGSDDYSNIVETVKAETEGQTSSWKIAKSVTKIKQFYSGRMVTSDENNSSEERSLSGLLTGKKLGKDYGFTIVYGNENDKHIGVDPGSEEMVDLNRYLPEDKRKGSLWLMSRGSNGVWYPHYVSIARTGEIEWENNPFFDNIRKHLKNIISNNSLESKLQSKIALNKSIFFPSGNKLSFSDDFVSIGGTKIKKVDYANESDYVEAIIQTIQSKNLRFQVSARALEEETTRNSIIEAGIIKSDLLQLEHIIGSFDIYGLTDIPSGTSTQHTGNRKVIPTTRTNTLYFGGQQYNEFINERGEVEYYDSKNNKVDSHPLYEQLKAISDITKGVISGITIGDSVLYKIPHGSNKFFYIEQKPSQPLKFINGRTYNSKINKAKKKNNSLPPAGGLLSEMSAGVATPEQEEVITQEQPSTNLLGAMSSSPAAPAPNEFDLERMLIENPPFEVPTTEEVPTSTTTEEKQQETEVKQESKPKPKVVSRKDSFKRVMSRAKSKQDIDGWIISKHADIIKLAQDTGFEGTLSKEVIKGLLEKNNIPVDTIKDADDLLSKLDYILNCKQE